MYTIILSFLFIGNICSKFAHVHFSLKGNINMTYYSIIEGREFSLVE